MATYMLNVDLIMIDNLSMTLQIGKISITHLLRNNFS